MLSNDIEINEQKTKLASRRSRSEATRNGTELAGIKTISGGRGVGDRITRLQAEMCVRDGMRWNACNHWDTPDRNRSRRPSEKDEKRKRAKRSSGIADARESSEDAAVN